MNDNNRTVTVEEALEHILRSILQLGWEEVSILEAQGYVLYENIISEIDIPQFNNSAMDGYAILADDSEGASKENPIILQVTDEIKAGAEYIKKMEVKKNTAIRIMTGAPIPAGADAVIPFEDTYENKGLVSIFKVMKKGVNIRLAGEDIKSGTVVLRKGDRLKSADIGLLASLNYRDIKVSRRPEVAIISTGDEVAELGEDMRPGQIRNSNSYALYSEAKRYNALPHYYGIAKDCNNSIREKLSEASEADIVITTGGVSMGKYDLVKDVFSELGIEILFEWIKMKPGRPCIFGRKENKLYFGLPGNPVSTMISFIQFVRPAILKLMGANRIKKPIIDAISEDDIKKKPDRTNFIRGLFTIKNGIISVKSTGPQGSGILRSMSEANCLIVLPLGTDKVSAGDRIPIQLIHHEEIE